MNTLMQMAIAPVLIIAIYIYIRDKYEKEPIRILLLGVFFGFFITLPIMAVEMILTLLTPETGLIGEAFYVSFIIASATEEFFKYIVLYFLIWRYHHFNEKFDGIVYAVFISLGFAGIENIMYVINPSLGGLQTAIMRAVLSVPGHALFGVAMGYYFSLAKFEPKNKKEMLVKALAMPWLLHGIYDFILLAHQPILAFFFIPFVVYLWIQGFQKMKKHIQDSPFKHKVQE